MARHRRQASPGQHRRLQSLAQPARRPEGVGESTRLQRTLHARGLPTHVRAPTRPPPRDVCHDHAVGVAHEPDELVLRTASSAPQTRAGRDMLHAPVDGGSASDADGAGASVPAAGSVRAASHSSAAA
jgi:hypothetical protein